ncbi:MAG: TetR/AcrR family transcriptional regulator [Spirochaetota bacterium]|nr:TetR/AcrR family transcriptional regulator [Spirochaetota bacterium]
MIKTDRRNSILSCAEEIFANKGYFATSISDIIQSASIARGTFYIYFDSKKAIFDALVDDLLYLIDNAIKRIDISNSATEPLEQLKDNMLRVASVLYDKSNLTKILLTYAKGIDSDFDQKIDSFYKMILHQIESAISLGMEMELIRICNPKIIASCILGSIKEVSHSLIFNSYSIEHIEEVVDEIIQFALTGLLIK